MKCPKCGLINPESAIRCDCGYDFESKSIKSSYLSTKEQQQIKEAQKGDLYAAAKIGINKGVVGGIIMISIAAIMFIVGKMIGGFFYYSPVQFAIGVFALVKGIVKGNITGNNR